MTKRKYESCHGRILQKGCETCFPKSFASYDPKKVACWSSKNVQSPDQVAKCCNKFFLFDCDVCHHTFSKGLNSVISGHWCPMCAGQKLCVDSSCNFCYQKSFAAYPDEMKVGSWSKNNILQPRQVFMHSKHIYLFECNVCGHEFSASLDNISGKGQWCNFCVSKGLCENITCSFCFDKSFASCERASEWNYTKNDGITPRQVLKSSNKRYYFTCRQCKHDVYLNINSITAKGEFCNICSHHQLCDSEECKMCFKNSFASFNDEKKVACFSSKNACTPRQVAMFSNKRFIFVCDQCDHEFNPPLHSVTHLGSWCGICSGRSVCHDISCKSCHDRSLAKIFENLGVTWSSKNPMTPRDVTKFSGQSAIFECKTCHHEFTNVISLIVRRTTGIKCQFCTGLRCCGDAECKICFRVCEIRSQCEKSRARVQTRVTKRWVCRPCFNDCIQRDPEETPLQLRTKITLEIFMLAELQRRSCERMSVFANWSSWDCAVLPNCSRKMDCAYFMDENGNVFAHIGPNPLDFKLVHYAIVVEIIEESRNVHSMARDTPDETREKEIREMYVQLTQQCHVAFVYVTVAHNNFKSWIQKPHVDDIFFQRQANGSGQYEVIPDRTQAWENRIDELINMLETCLATKSNGTFFIGH